MRFGQFIEACKDNDVWKNASIYIVSSWVLLQVISLIAEPLGFTSAIVADCLIILLVVFPIFLFLLWKFRLAKTKLSTEILDEDGVTLPQQLVKKKFNVIYFSFLGIIATISLGIVFFIAQKDLVVNNKAEVFLKSGDKIAVMKFENNTGKTSNDLVGKMAVDWIIHGITRNELGQVISPKIIDDYAQVIRAAILPENQTSLVIDYLKPSQIIEGEYYLQGSKLIFQCSINNENLNETLISFDPVSCDQDSPLDCIEALKQRILGYFVEENRKEVSLEDRPPKFMAYELFNKALDLRSENNANYLNYLKEAIKVDSTFFEPRAYEFMYYYNNEEYATADSLLRNLRLYMGSFKRQRQLLNLYEALLKGNHRNAYEYQKSEYNITPFHLETNSNMMVFSLQFVNKPEAVDSIFREIDMKKFNIPKCIYCQERYKIQGLSQITLGNYKSAISLLEPFYKESGLENLKKVLLRAHIQDGNLKRTKELLKEFKEFTNKETWKDLYLFATKDLIIAGMEQEANELLNIIIAEEMTKNEELGTTSPYLLESLFYLKDYKKIEPLLQKWVLEHPMDFDFKVLYALSLYGNGNIKDAENQISELLSMEAPYQYGDIEYALGQYYAVTGDTDKSINYLTKAIAEGHWYETSGFENDPLLKGLTRNDSFKKVMTYWH
ncbi:tetratricopeptide repeat protein [Maribacter sp. CXY002]|uniref:tetratricopeptide repeat protein n=1 Tax=Maribacter luteocoastalis TaxID=3407671 RepID=UPI003B66D673